MTVHDAQRFIISINKQYSFIMYYLTIEKMIRVAENTFCLLKSYLASLSLPVLCRLCQTCDERHPRSLTLTIRLSHLR